MRNKNLVECFFISKVISDVPIKSLLNGNHSVPQDVRQTEQLSVRREALGSAAHNETLPGSPLRLGELDGGGTQPYFLDATGTHVQQLRSHKP